MRVYGFSTGAIARGNYSKALKILDKEYLLAIELSALREPELPELVRAVAEDRIDVSRFQHVSFHAPSVFSMYNECEVIEMLDPIVRRGWSIIVHPDAISDFSRWSAFGSLLCIENMDQRKPIGRTVDELSPIFDRLPEASLCLDLAHCRQIDSTMSQAARILRTFGDRLKELHVSELNADCGHEPMSRFTVRAYQRIAHLIPPLVPVIIESPIGLIKGDSLTDDCLLKEIRLVESSLSADAPDRLTQQVA